MSLEKNTAGNAAKNPEKEEKGESNYLDSLTDRIEEMRGRLNGFSTRIATGAINSRSQFSQIRTIRQQCIQFLYSALFEQGFGRRSIGGSDSGYGNISDWSASGRQLAQSNVSVAAVNMQTMSIDRVFSYQETETTTYSTQGKVKCADGREIEFNLNLQMSRSFQQLYEENYTAFSFNACDPLIINLDGNIPEFSDQTFLFDIDADGEADRISKLAKGSGYLALDKNGDGIINDGSELFGTASGDGFADLAKYDSDGNGWIDEGDEIWNKLKIWVMDENGEGQLYGLSEKGIGAICLSSVGTDFTLTDADNTAQAQIRKTGVFLYENGGVGTMQHVDVVKYDSVS